MPALEAGVRAPEFSLPTVDGKTVSLADELKKGPVVLAFFKVSCPVCQYAFPFYERMYQATRTPGVPAHYAVSNAYGLTNVPTLFYIEPSGQIEISSVSWSKADLEAIAAKL